MRKVPDIRQVARVVIDVADELCLGSVALKSVTTKDDGSVVTDLDLRIQERIFAELDRRWPSYLRLGEEMEHVDQSRILSEAEGGIWVLDPLDGSTNLSVGFPFYGISLALIASGGVELGVVHDPIRDECFWARRGIGAHVNGDRIAPRVPSAMRQCVANVDYKRLVTRIAERLVRSPPYRSQRNLGSCVLEWCWLAAGRIQLYLHGGQNIWDYAAGSLVLSEAGGVATDIGGARLDGSKLAKTSVIAATTPELYRQWTSWVARNDSPRGRGTSHVA
jgi:myo-inositol-1(or 4)-monophosphatase